MHKSTYAPICVIYKENSCVNYCRRNQAIHLEPKRIKKIAVICCCQREECLSTLNIETNDFELENWSVPLRIKSSKMNKHC